MSLRESIRGAPTEVRLPETETIVPEKAQEASLDVSVVLPVFNEQGHATTEIARIRKALEQSAYSFEIIVVDDGSTDNSLEEIKRIQGIRVIRLGSNCGTGVARRIGTRAARGSTVVWTDVDMTYPNDRIPDLVANLEGYDQVVGARESEAGTKKLLRVPAKWAIRRLASYLLKTPIPDLNSGFRAFRRDVGQQFIHQLPSGFSCVTTLSMSFLANGYSINYMPIQYKQRSGSSKFHAWTDTKRYLKQVVRMVLSYEPLRVFLPAGFFFGTIGVAKLLYDVIGKDFRVATNTLLILFVAFQFFMVGLLADLVVRVSTPLQLTGPAQVEEEVAEDGLQPRRAS